MGRLAGVLFLTSAGLLLISLPLSPAKANIPGTVAVAASGIAVGTLAVFAPLVVTRCRLPSVLRA